MQRYPAIDNTQQSDIINFVEKIFLSNFFSAYQAPLETSKKIELKPIIHGLNEDFFDDVSMRDWY